MTQDARQEFELVLGRRGIAAVGLSAHCIRMIRNALPFANAGHDDYLAATEQADPLPRDTWTRATPKET